MPRPKEFDVPTALERALEVFWEKGYEGTSIADLAERTGVGRQSLYDTFGDKRAIYLAALERYADRSDEALAELVRDPGPPLGAIERFLLSIVEGPRADCRRGCFAVNAAVERGAGDPDVARAVRANLRALERGFAALLARAEAERAIAPVRDLRALARFLAGTVVALRAVGRVDPDRGALRDVVAVALDAVRGRRRGRRE